MLILFLHGWQSTPGGVKPTYLAQHGHEVLNPALPDDDFDEAVRIAQAECDRHHPDVVLGSSRGGAVAMNIKAGDTPLVLLCPAWKRWGTATKVKAGTLILHSPADDVVPFSDSVELVRNSGLPSDSLIEVGTEHRLADDESLKKMLEAVDRTAKLRKAPQETLAGYQFGISTLLVVTTVYAVLFAVLRTLQTPPSAFITIVLFFTTVGLGQRFLFKGQRRRTAAMIAGACFFVAWFFIYGAVYGLHPFSPFEPVEWAFFGAIFGYLAGLLISGTFLLIRKLPALWSRYTDW